MLNEDDPPRPDYIARLRAEITRAEAESTRKQATLDAAHSFFPTPPS